MQNESVVPSADCTRRGKTITYDQPPPRPSAVPPGEPQVHDHYVPGRRHTLLHFSGRENSCGSSRRVLPEYDGRNEKKYKIPEI